MHSLVNELAKKLNLSPEEAQEAVEAVQIRIRAGLETIGEVEIEGLGTFRSIDGRVIFEAAPKFADEINKEFAGMKPIALTQAGESVDPDDRRALPGVDPAQGDGNEAVADEASVSELQEQTEPPRPLTSPAASYESEDGDSTFEPASSFTSPPPPRPSKIRVPPSERRSSRPRRRFEESDEVPDMGPVVTTRPVEPIAGEVPRRRRSRAPLAMAVGIVAVGLVSWLILGGTDDEPASSETIAEVAQSESSSEQVSVESAAEIRAEDPEEEPMPPQGEPEVEVAEAEPSAETEPPTETEQPAETEYAVAPQERTLPRPEAGQEPEQPEVAGVEVAPLPDSGPVYAWIVASYTSSSEAEDRADRMRQSGLDANVFEATVRGAAAFRVGIGRFESEADARRGQDMVPPEAADAWITRVK